MEQVIFCREGPELLRREMRTRAYAVVTLTDAGISGPQRPIAAKNRSPQSHLETGTSRVAHRREHRHCRRTDSLVCNAFHLLRGDCPDQLGAVFQGRVTRVRRHVTFTLQARNAKNIFTGKTLSASAACSNFARNVTQIPAKFHQNPAVSDAVDSLFDCKMLNTNLTTHRLRWPTAASASSRQALHRHDAPLPPTMNGGVQ